MDQRRDGGFLYAGNISCRRLWDGANILREGTGKLTNPGNVRGGRPMRLPGG
jgi:hypothetical protein